MCVQLHPSVMNVIIHYSYCYVYDETLATSIIMLINNDYDESMTIVHLYHVVCNTVIDYWLLIMLCALYAVCIDGTVLLFIDVEPGLL